MGKMIGGNSASASCSYDRKAVQMGFGSENTINDTVTNSSHNVSHSNGRMCVSALSPEAACRLWHCKWPASQPTLRASYSKNPTRINNSALPNS
ncbi:hypothetical protein NW761_002621 [Fusarium oxysporum]|nr:hypothetical protein NW758_001121 [Fusarium oxysporum]KAJ4103820.1 hypothetical protein NW761_002621 [Fusarium oxysporum]